jgi:hypothetical protein
MAFCGPTAIAALTGLSTAEVERVVLRYRRLCLEPQPRGWLRTVKGMRAGEISGVLASLGYRVVEHTELGDPPPRSSKKVCVYPTFASWLRYKEPGLWLVSITGHFMAVNGDWFCDTRHRLPIELRNLKSYARSRVHEVWRIEPRSLTQEE